MNEATRSVFYAGLFPALWLAWGAWWWYSARNTKATAREESVPSRLLHVVPLMLAALLLWLPELPVFPLNLRWLPRAAWTFWVGAAVTAAGLLFCVWARRHIGANWSGTVTIKHGHELVTSGPYGLARHPIYTGLLLAFAGSALARGEVRGILAVAIVAAALWRKLRNEERWMEQRFGHVYRDYRRKVAALVPFIF